MSKKIEQPKDPLLDDEVAQGDDVGEEAVDTTAKGKKGKTVKADAQNQEKSGGVKTEAKSPEQLLKEEAVAKFPKDTVAQTKYILDNSPKVQFVVPQVEGEFGEETVQINGYKLTIKKNVMVSIPVQVAKIIAEKYRINLELGKDVRIDRDNKTSEALS